MAKKKPKKYFGMHLYSYSTIRNVDYPIIVRNPYDDPDTLECLVMLDVAYSVKSFNTENWIGEVYRTLEIPEFCGENGAVIITYRHPRNMWLWDAGFYLKDLNLIVPYSIYNMSFKQGAVSGLIWNSLKNNFTKEEYDDYIFSFKNKYYDKVEKCRKYRDDQYPYIKMGVFKKSDVDQKEVSLESFVDDLQAKIQTLPKKDADVYVSEQMDIFEDEVRKEKAELYIKEKEKRELLRLVRAFRDEIKL